MFFHQGNPWNLVDAYCDFLLGPDSGLRYMLESMDERYRDELSFTTHFI